MQRAKKGEVWRMRPTPKDITTGDGILVELVSSFEQETRQPRYSTARQDILASKQRGVNHGHPIGANEYAKPECVNNRRKNRIFTQAPRSGGAQANSIIIESRLYH